MNSIQGTPKGERLHIAFFGRRNAGKSTLINAVTKQPIAIVSPVAGTTTDPVYKAMEILPLGPVMLIDTAGIDDIGELGEMRIEKTKKIYAQADIACVVVNTKLGISSYEKDIIKELQEKNTSILLVINQIEEMDTSLLEEKVASLWPTVPCVTVQGQKGEGLLSFMDQLQTLIPEEIKKEPTLLDGVVKEGDFILLITPIDGSAPKGRLILPQVQAIRTILDKKAYALVAQPQELPTILQRLPLPDLAITDSQVFKEAAQALPLDCPLTSFSILMARYKGDLKELALGARAIDQLKNGDKVLIAEGCTHRRQCEDIGTVKIPNWLKAKGLDLSFTWTAGTDYPEDLQDYKLIIHCGGCMLHRKEMMRRMKEAQAHHIPIVNYGVLIAKLHGILDRALAPFKNEI